MDHSVGPDRCECCGLVPVWFGERTWCLCEPTPRGVLLCGTRHECSAARRLHRHRFVHVIVEEDWCSTPLRMLIACGCGQERAVSEVT